MVMPETGAGTTEPARIGGGRERSKGRLPEPSPDSGVMPQAAVDPLVVHVDSGPPPRGTPTARGAGREEEQRGSRGPDG
jgi:hypothetical protein